RLAQHRYLLSRPVPRPPVWLRLHHRESALPHAGKTTTPPQPPAPAISRLVPTAASSGRPLAAAVGYRAAAFGRNSWWCGHPCPALLVLSKWFRGSGNSSVAVECLSYEDKTAPFRSFGEQALKTHKID